MIQQDYLMRMIEQLGAFVRAIAGGKAGREQLDGQLDEMALECLGLPMVLLLALPPEEAYRLMEASERAVPEKAFLLGEMLVAKAATADSAAEAEAWRAKARYLFGRAKGQVGGEFELRIAARIAEQSKGDS